MQGLCYDLAKGDQVVGPENTEYTVRAESLIGHIALIDEEITKVLQELKIDDQRRSHRPSPCDLESPWLCSKIR